MFSCSGTIGLLDKTLPNEHANKPLVNWGKLCDLFTKNEMFVLLALVLVFAVDAAIILDFNLDGDDATHKVFRLSGVERSPPDFVDVGALRPVFTVNASSNPLEGAKGTLTVSLVGKRKRSTPDAADWKFGPNAMIVSTTTGIGVQDNGESDGSVQLTDGDAILVKFDVSHLELEPGAILSFSLLTEKTNSFRIYQKSESKTGILMFEQMNSTKDKFTDEITVIAGSPRTSSLSQFAITDIKGDGGSPLRIKGLKIDVKGNILGPSPALSQLTRVVSSDSAIILDFNRAGNSTVSKVLQFNDVGSSSLLVTDVGTSTPAFTISSTSQKLIGASGTLTVTWNGKSSINASAWHFEKDAMVQPSTFGLGVQSAPQAHGKTEALVVRFNTSSLTLSPGARLVFSVTSAGGESYRLYQRTGDSLGTEILEMRSFSQPVVSDPILVTSGYEPSPGIHEFAIADVGWDGGGFLHINRFSVGTVGGAAAMEYVPPRFHNIFSNHMMLQRDMPVAVFGTATPGIMIIVNFANIQSKQTVADNSGYWYVQLNAMEASFVPGWLVVTDGMQAQVVSNVLVGDIWLCSGQSNMDRPFWTFESLSTSGKDNPLIRLVKVTRGGPLIPSETLTLDPVLDSSWQECSSTYLENFSPGAYFFGARMEENMSVPMGLMQVAVGATRIEEWVSAEMLASVGIDPTSNDEYTRNYNGMIHPLRNFTFKGILWYQGESNAVEPAKYAQLFPGLINSWRTLFARGDIPFYYAQLASVGQGNFDVTDTAIAFLREAQATALSLPNAKMIVLTDAGEFKGKHPENKQAVGDRWARLAMVAEGRTDLNINSPTYDTMTISGNQAIVNFTNVGSGLETRLLKMNYNEHLAQGMDPEAFVVPANELWGFAISGANRVFVDANAAISGINEVTVWSSYVETPVAVRYCFKWFGLCNLYAKDDGWVATPFRTDNWPIPNFYGDSTGELFDGNYASLGDPMTMSMYTGTSVITNITISNITGYKVTDKGSRKVYFYTSNGDFKYGPRPYVVVKILYYDQGQSTDEISVQYDGATNAVAIGTIQILFGNTLTWRVAQLVLHDAQFSDRLSGKDMRIETPRTDIIIKGVYLSGYRSSNIIGS